MYIMFNHIMCIQMDINNINYFIKNILNYKFNIINFNMINNYLFNINYIINYSNNNHLYMFNNHFMCKLNNLLNIKYIHFNLNNSYFQLYY